MDDVLAADQELFVVPILDLTLYNNVHITCRVQLSDRTLQEKVSVHDMPYGMTIQHWYNPANPKRNPNNRN